MTKPPEQPREQTTQTAKSLAVWPEVSVFILVMAACAAPPLVHWTLAPDFPGWANYRPMQELDGGFAVAMRGATAGLLFGAAAGVGLAITVRFGRVSLAPKEGDPPLDGRRFRAGIAWAAAAVVLACMTFLGLCRHAPAYAIESRSGWPVIYSRTSSHRVGTRRIGEPGREVFTEAFASQTKVSALGLILDVAFAVLMATLPLIVGRAITRGQVTLREMFALMGVAAVMLGIFAAAPALGA
jgi:hypothetical protein